LDRTDLSLLEEQWDRHAAVYDLIYGVSEQSRLEPELGFLDYAFEALARRPINDILDLTAGTGLQAVALARQGYSVTASDLSAAMLARCRSRAAAAGVDLADTVHRSATEIDEENSHDVCLSCFFGLSHLLGEDEMSRAFAGVRRALRPGGLFVFDLINLLEDALTSSPRSERSGVRDGVRFRSVMESRYDTWLNLLHFSEETEVVDVRGNKRRSHAEFTYRGWSRGKIVSLLDRAGFEEISTFRGYEDRGESTDDRVFKTVYACRK